MKKFLATAEATIGKGTERNGSILNLMVPEGFQKFLPEKVQYEKNYSCTNKRTVGFFTTNYY